MESLKVGKLESWRSKMPSFETILEAYDKVIIKNMWPRSDEERRRGRRQRGAFRARLVKMYLEEYRPNHYRLMPDGKRIYDPLP